MRRTLCLLLGLFIALSAFSACAVSALDGLISIDGEVSYVALEGGFYSLGGYRLVSDDSTLKPFLNKKVIAKGYLDTAPSTSMVKSLRISQIVEQSETAVSKISIEGTLLYDYDQKAYVVREYRLQWDEQYAKDFGTFVKVDGKLDKNGVIAIDSIESVDAESIHQQASDEVFYATYRNTNNRLKYALCNMVAINGSVKKDSLYQKLSKQLSKADGVLNLYVNGRKIKLDEEALPILKRSQPMISVQAACDAFGLFQAQTFAADNKILLSKDDFNMTFELDKRTAIVDGKTFTLPYAVTSQNGRAMLPARFIAEKLGYKTLWINNGKVFAAFKA